MISAAEIINGYHGLELEELLELSRNLHGWRDRIHNFCADLKRQHGNSREIAHALALEISTALHDSSLDYLIQCLDDEIRDTEEVQGGHDEHRTDFYAASGVPTGAPL